MLYAVVEYETMFPFDRFVLPTYRHGKTIIPSTEAEDEVTRLADVDAVPDLIVQERKSLKSQDIAWSN